MNKIIIIILAALVLILSFLSVKFFSQNTQSKSSFSKLEDILKKVEDETLRLKEENKTVISENERFQEDAITYSNISIKLKEEKEKLEVKYSETETALKKTTDELGKLKIKMTSIQKNEYNESKALREENSILKEKTQSLENTLKAERSLYHYNLGVAYTKAKLFDEALNAYARALKIDPDNADTHYNLGLLYENYEKDSHKAVFHYNQYLKLEKDAKDIEEVNRWINKLTKKLVDPDSN